MEAGVVPQDSLVQVSQLPARLDPQLRDDHPPGLAIDLHRLEPPTAADQGENQLGMEALLQRMLALTLTGMASAQAQPASHTTTAPTVSAQGIAPGIGFCGPEKCEF